MPALTAQPVTPASISAVNSTEVFHAPQASTMRVAMAMPMKPNRP
jgi:hypothetical protein